MTLPTPILNFDPAAPVVGSVDRAMPSGGGSDKATNVLTLRKITKTQDFALLQPDWEKLTQEPMQSFAWNFSWWQHLGGDANLHLYCLQRDGELIAIAPLYRDKWLSQNRLRFLASGDACTDYVQLIGDPKWHHDFAGLIADDLATTELFSVIELEGVTDSYVADELNRKLRDNHWSYAKPIEQSWVLDLPGDWDEFFFSCSKSLKRKIRSAQKRLDSGQCRIESTLDGLDRELALSTLIELHQMRFVDKGEPGVFSEKGFTNFFSQAVGKLISQGQAEILVAYGDEKAIGAHILLHTPDGPQYYQGGIDVQQMKLEPGHLLFTFAIRRAIAAGKSRYDFLRGNEPYKQFWGASAKPLWTVRYVANKLRATALNRAFLTLRTVKHSVKQSATRLRG
jgi:CelD/BcsL family acetyltransferase involved in cellulose biosynthesis